MRLLHIHTWQFQEFHSDPPPYAITSHRWTNQELTFQDLAGPSLPSHVTEKTGYQKLRGFCLRLQHLMEICPKLKIEYIWMDSCCIDKKDSVELQEALNSMFRWYFEAELCMVYLFDVVSLDEYPSTLIESFKASVWHKRGWCLQELLAPKRILFYNQDWELIGRKRTKWETSWITARAGGIMPLNSLLANASGVPENILWDFALHINEYKTEEKHAWMAGRSTTRLEDRVYCQLGIFGVFMPLIYGEGEHARIRLEDAIAQKQRIQAAAVKPDSEGPARTTVERRFVIYFHGLTSINETNGLQVTIHNSADKTVNDLETEITKLLHDRQIPDPGPWQLQNAWKGLQLRVLKGSERLVDIVENELHFVVVLKPSTNELPPPVRRKAVNEALSSKHGKERIFEVKCKVPDRRDRAEYLFGIDAGAHTRDLETQILRQLGTLHLKEKDSINKYWSIRDLYESKQISAYQFVSEIPGDVLYVDLVEGPGYTTAPAPSSLDKKRARLFPTTAAGPKPSPSARLFQTTAAGPKPSASPPPSQKANSAAASAGASTKPAAPVKLRKIEIEYNPSSWSFGSTKRANVEIAEDQLVLALEYAVALEYEKISNSKPRDEAKWQTWKLWKGRDYTEDGRYLKSTELLSSIKDNSFAAVLSKNAGKPPPGYAVYSANIPREEAQWEQYRQ